MRVGSVQEEVPTRIFPILPPQGVLSFNQNIEQILFGFMEAAEVCPPGNVADDADSGLPQFCCHRAHPLSVNSIYIVLCIRSKHKKIILAFRAFPSGGLSTLRNLRHRESSLLHKNLRMRSDYQGFVEKSIDERCEKVLERFHPCWRLSIEMLYGRAEIAKHSFRKKPETSYPANDAGLMSKGHNGFKG